MKAKKVLVWSWWKNIIDGVIDATPEDDLIKLADGFKVGTTVVLELKRDKSGYSCRMSLVPKPAKPNYLTPTNLAIAKGLIAAHAKGGAR